METLEHPTCTELADLFASLTPEDGEVTELVNENCPGCGTAMIPIQGGGGMKCPKGC